MGTVGYASPEQHENFHHVDQRSDIFSFGAVLYRLVTGTPAFPVRDKHAKEAEEAVRQCTFKRPSECDPNIPRELEGIILKCLSHQESRYATADAVADELRRFLDGKRLENTPCPSLIMDLVGWCRRQKVAAAVVAVLVVIACCLAYHGQVVRKERAIATDNYRKSLELLTQQVESLAGPLPEEIRHPEVGLGVAFYRATEFVESRLTSGDSSPHTIKYAILINLYTGNAFRLMGEDAKAEQHCARALQLYDQFRDEWPDQVKLLGINEVDLYKCLAASLENEDAITYERRALEISRRRLNKSPNADNQIDLCGGHNNMANRLWNVGRVDKANNEFRIALREAEKLHEDYPDVPRSGHVLACIKLNYSNFLFGTGLGSTDQCMELANSARCILKTYTTQEHNFSSLSNLARAHWFEGRYYKGHPGFAIQLFEEAERIYVKLARHFPHIDEYTTRLNEVREDIRVCKARPNQFLTVNATDAAAEHPELLQTTTGARNEPSVCVERASINGDGTFTIILENGIEASGKVPSWVSGDPSLILARPVSASGLASPN